MIGKNQKMIGKYDRQNVWSEIGRKYQRVCSHGSDE